MSVLISILSVLACVGLAWLAFKIEPHWCSKDGRRMIARAQAFPERGRTSGSWSEVRVFIDDEQLTIRTRGLRAVALRGDYTVAAKSADPPKKRQVYVLRGERQVLLRIPDNSRGVAVLDAMIGAAN